jgi:hypothetical protein
MPNATLRSSVARLDTFQVRGGGVTVVMDSTISVPASTTVGFEIVFARVKTGARINGLSRIYNDALGAGVTLSMGFKAVGGNFTSSTTALSTAFTVATANVVGVLPFTDHVNAGRFVWEILGLTSDPGGFADVCGYTAGATTTASAQDVTMTLVYTDE